MSIYVLVFFIHSVNTQDANYAKRLIKNIKSYKNEIKFIFKYFSSHQNKAIKEYPLIAAVKNEINSNILFLDQYVWQDANVAEKALRTIGQEQLAIVTGVTDAHNFYFENNISGLTASR